MVTTFLTPYIMKAAVPCYNALYKHASERLRAKIDQREEEVAKADTPLTTTDAPSLADKARNAVRHTYVTKRLVNLFITNMSANDEHPSDQEPK